jgi:hypothetical protein
MRPNQLKPDPNRPKLNQTNPNLIVNNQLDLNQAKIEGSGIELRAVDGRIVTVHHDRRKQPTEPTKAYGKRRKKPPAGLEDLTGTGMLWVAIGHFSVRAKDMERWVRGWMRILPGTNNPHLNELIFHVVTLEPQPQKEQSPLAQSKRDSWSTWKFRALVVPNADQLDLLPVQLELNEIKRPKPTALGVAQAQSNLSTQTLPMFELSDSGLALPAFEQVKPVSHMRDRLEGNGSIWAGESNEVRKDLSSLEFDMDF